jgi:hypothetical protein
VAGPLFGESQYAGAILASASVLLLLLTLRAAGVRPDVVRVVVAIAVVPALVAAAGDLATDGAAPAWVSGLIAALFAATPFLVLRRVLSHEQVTLSSVAGALCAYMLIGITFGLIYRTMSAADTDAFSQELGTASNYFSFVTLTTTGYGDITPVSGLARSLATLEAVLGQVVLVTLVARLVTTLGQGRLRAAQPESPDVGEDDAGPPN